MNRRDQHNLDFLMRSPKRDFDMWLEQASSEDIDYALGIVRKSKLENLIETIELQEMMAEFEDDMDEAKEVLEKFKLK